MTRFVPAARQLISQVDALRGEPSVVTPADEPDGFGRNRAVRFDPATSKWLDPILKAVTDPRIVDTSYKGKSGAKTLTVTFSPDIRADFAHPFPLADAAEILG